MKLALHKQLMDDTDSVLQAGDIVLVDLDYRWNANRAEVLLILNTKRGPHITLDKESLNIINLREFYDFKDMC